MHISLGVNLSHDPSAALCIDGRPVVAIASERLCRLKHGFPPMKRYHFELPWDAICYCLDAVGIGIDRCNRIVLNKAGGEWDWRLSDLIKTIPITDKSKIVCLNTHHDAHAIFSYNASNYDEALVLVADRFGSYIPNHGYEAETGYLVRNGKFQKLFSNFVPLSEKAFGNFIEEHSLTALYQIVTLHYGFFSRMDECGKTMGLAPYGQQLSSDPFWIKLKEDFSLDCEGFYNYCISKNMINTQDMNPMGFSYHTINRVVQKNYREVSPDLARQIQFEVEETVIEIINRMVNLTGIRKVCLSGGLFHNSVLNGKILRLPYIDDVFIPPAPSDDGNAIGCAYYGSWLDNIQCHPLQNAFLGREYKTSEMKESLTAAGLNYKKMIEDALVDEVVIALKQGDIVGWFQGASEFGFRALGHRSILADPRDPGVRDYVNHYVKHREEFRPLAAMIMEDYVSKWFSMSRPSPFMIVVANSIKPKIVPAVTHIDGTCRVQTVKKSDGITYHILQKFYEETGVPLLLNTSFNAKGEPIIETPNDAINSFRSMNIDLLAIGPFLVYKRRALS